MFGTPAAPVFLSHHAKPAAAAAKNNAPITSAVKSGALNSDDAFGLEGPGPLSEDFRDTPHSFRSVFGPADNGGTIPFSPGVHEALRRSRLAFLIGRIAAREAVTLMAPG